jgi:hypothetical protein
MKLNIDVTVNFPGLAAILHHLSQIEGRIMSALSDLQAAVAQEDTAIASAITLLQGLKSALDAAIASGDPAALQALSTDIGNQTAALAAAVTANTPAAPAPAP